MRLKKDAGTNRFVMTPSKWIESTGAVANDTQKINELLNILINNTMKTITHSNAKEILFKNKSLKKEYDSLKSEYEFLVQLHKARIINNLTQKDLSRLSGIDQANISKIESGDYSPSLKTMKKLADAMNMDLKIEFIKRNKK